MGFAGMAPRNQREHVLLVPFLPAPAPGRGSPAQHLPEGGAHRAGLWEGAPLPAHALAALCSLQPGRAVCGGGGSPVDEAEAGAAGHLLSSPALCASSPVLSPVHVSMLVLK